jgi:6-pyruvoyltetrahydropterin/6-carboxytetrahydropterin synthase
VPGPTPASVCLTRAVEFSASLRCWRAELPAAENQRLYGRRASRHGHNYRLEVTLRGEPDPATGMVLDLKELKELLEREVVARFDHRDLNADTPYFEKLPPTPEHFALVLFRLLRAALPAGLLERVRLYEDPDTFAEVSEDGSTP